MDVENYITDEGVTLDTNTNITSFKSGLASQNILYLCNISLLVIPIHWYIDNDRGGRSDGGYVCDTCGCTAGCLVVVEAVVLAVALVEV